MKYDGTYWVVHFARSAVSSVTTDEIREKRLFESYGMDGRGYACWATAAIQGVLATSDTAAATGGGAAASAALLLFMLL
jgi:hypothetical protein